MGRPRAGGACSTGQHGQRGAAARTRKGRRSGDSSGGGRGGTATATGDEIACLCVEIRRVRRGGATTGRRGGPISRGIVVAPVTFHILRRYKEWRRKNMEIVIITQRMSDCYMAKYNQSKGNSTGEKQ